MNQLKPYWQHLTRQFEINDSDSDNIFDGIVEAYSEPQRVYHNLAHLQHLWRLLGEVPEPSEITVTVQLALWYHDIVYQPGKSDNELKSSQRLLADNFSLKFSDYIISSACKLIEATKYHQSHGDLGCRYFLDADMAILGSDTDTYQQYTNAIMAEHQHIPGFLYRRGRKKFLTQTLALPQIFHTNYFRQSYESQARSNIEAELNQL